MALTKIGKEGITGIDNSSNATAITIDSSENVGIGTTSPNSNTKLDVNGAARIGNSTDGIMIENNTGSFDISNASYIRRDSSSGALELTSGSTTARNMIFNTKTNGAESARIDSSGNFMVGKSAVDLDVAGVEFRAGAYNGMTNDGGVPLYLNRLTSDGGILEFRKDGTSIGNIGIASSTNDLFINSVASNHKGLRFGSGAIVPISNSAGTDDGTTTLGGATQRFNNLFLAGGVYLGGTGSANLLDDYEEGTWTPTAGSNFGTFSSESGYYLKIGQIVYIHCYFSYSGASTSATNRQVTGLPFTVKNIHTQTSIDGMCKVWSHHYGFAYFDGGTTNLYDNATAVLKNSFIAASNMRMSGFYLTDS